MTTDPNKKGTLSTQSRDIQSPVDIWGLTGGVAAGKSTVASIFKKLGYTVIDADQISHQLREEDGAAYPAIMHRFGTADHQKLREIVFGDPKARKDLEAIMHPLIQAESMHRISLLAAAQPGKKLLVFYEAALLVETQRYKTLSGLIVVDAPLEERLERLMARDGISEEIAYQILNSQISEEERRKAADFVIKNTGSIKELEAQVADFLQKVR